MCVPGEPQRDPLVRVHAADGGAVSRRQRQVRRAHLPHARRRQPHVRRVLRVEAEGTRTHYYTKLMESVVTVSGLSV